MKIRFFSVLLILFAFVLQPLVAQEQTELNQKDSEGQKVGKWKGYYNDGSVRYVGQFKNDIPFGIFYHYYGDGKLQTKMVYRTPEIVYTTMYYSTGEKLAEGKYINKQKDSTWLTYGEANKIVEKGMYVMGQKQGVWQTYFQNGEVSAEMNYKDDLKDGPYRIFYEDGTVKDSSNFKAGRMHGLTIIYDTEGGKIVEGNYKEGKRHQDWLYYGEDKKVEKVLKYEEGKLLNPEDLKTILDDLDKFSGNRKDVLEFEDLRGTINYE